MTVQLPVTVQLIPGMLLLDPGDQGFGPRVWTAIGAKTVIRQDEGTQVKATLKRPGVPEGWRVIDDRALAASLMEAAV